MKFKPLLLAGIITLAPFSAFAHAPAPDDKAAYCKNEAADTKPGNTEKPKKCGAALMLILPVLAGLAIASPPGHAKASTSKGSSPAVTDTTPPAQVASVEPTSPPDVSVPPSSGPVGAPAPELGAGIPGLLGAIGAGFVGLRRRFRK